MNQEASRGGTRSRLVLAGIAAVVLLLLVWLMVSVLSGDDEDGPGATDGPSGDQASAFPSTTMGADGSPLPSKAPGQTAPTGVVKTRPAMAPVKVGLRDAAELGDGVTARVVEIESVQGKGRGPGEVSGPSIRVTVEVTNNSGKPLRTVASTMVAFYGQASRPALDLSAPGVYMLPTEIAPGESGRGRYVFRIPAESRDRVRLDFSYNADVPKVIFTGSV